MSQAVPKSIVAAMLLAVVGGFVFIRPYIGTVMFAVLVAYIFSPVYLSILRRVKRKGIALVATVLVALLSLILPLIVVIGITIGQANTLITKFQSGDVSVGTAQVDNVVEQGTDRVNNLVRALPGGESLTLDKQKVTDTLKRVGTQLVQGVVNFITQAAGAFFGLISTSILLLFLVLALLRYQFELLDFVKKLSPFRDDITDRYFDRAGAMTKAMVKGQLVLAVVQGFASAFSLWLVGLDYFGFFFVILTFLSFIPLGAGILTIPIGIIIALTGNVPQGVFVVLFHVLVVSNIDNILRPRLVPKEARLNSGLMLLAVFSGLAAFGAAGVVYGPVLMILLITTFQMYADYNQRVEKPLA